MINTLINKFEQDIINTINRANMPPALTRFVLQSVIQKVAQAEAQAIQKEAREAEAQATKKKAEEEHKEPEPESPEKESE